MINCRQIAPFPHPIICNINYYIPIETICDGIAMVDTLIRAAVAATYHAIVVEIVSEWQKQTHISNLSIRPPVSSQKLGK